MKHFLLLLAALLFAPAYQAAAQTGMPKKAEPSMKVPSDPGMQRPPPSGEKMPSDPGAVVTPPTTGTEEIVKTPNKAVDPKIDDATTDIDRKNRKKSEQKSAQ
jgi:hypothetical protein